VSNLEFIFRTVRQNSCASFLHLMRLPSWRENSFTPTRRWGGNLPKPHPNFLGTLLYFWATRALDIFKRQLIATLVTLLCQKCGRKSAELGKRSEVLEIVDNSMQ
jgi:hypothetical protein